MRWLNVVFFSFRITIYLLPLDLCDQSSREWSSLRIVHRMSLITFTIVLSDQFYMKLHYNQISGFPLKGSFNIDSESSSSFSSSSHIFLIVSFLCLHASTPSATLLSPISLAPFTRAEVRGIRIPSYSLKIVSSSSDEGGSAEGLYFTSRRTRW